jgi:DNA-binding CsgD family transcriptional regulator
VTACSCGIQTHQPSGICVICEMEDRNPQLHISMGIYRVRFSLGQAPQQALPSHLWSTRTRPASVRNAALAAGRRTTAKGLLARGFRILRELKSGKSYNQIAKDLGMSPGAVAHWAKKNKKRMAEDAVV